MEPQILIIASGQTMSLCDHEGTVKIQISLGYAVVALAMTEKLIMCGGSDGSAQNCRLCVFDLDCVKLQTIKTEFQPWSISCDKPGNQVACAMANGNVVTYKLEDNVFTQCLQISTQEESTIAWLNENEICTGNHHGTITIWDSTTGAILRQLPRSSPAPSSSLCVVLTDKDMLLCGFQSDILSKWNVDETAAVDFKLTIKAVRQIIVNKYNTVIIACNFDTLVTAFDFESLEQLWQFQCLNWVASLLNVGDEVFVGVCNSRVIVLDVSTGQQLRELPLTHKGYIFVVAPLEGHKFQYVD